MWSVRSLCDASVNSEPSCWSSTALMAPGAADAALGAISASAARPAASHGVCLLLSPNTGTSSSVPTRHFLSIEIGCICRGRGGPGGPPRPWANWALRRGRRERERQGLAVPAGPQGVPDGDVLLEVQRD